MSCDVCQDMLEVDAIVDRWGRNPEFAIEMLQDIQDRFRHLPKAALMRMSERMGADLGRLYHIATFFKAFSLKPRGEIEVQVCTGTACHVRGAARVVDAFSRELDVPRSVGRLAAFFDRAIQRALYECHAHNANASGVAFCFRARAVVRLTGRHHRPRRDSTGALAIGDRSHHDSGGALYARHGAGDAEPRTLVA